MSGKLSAIEARERLHARLWVDECAVDGDGRLAVAGHRLWCALREQGFHADVDGHRLSSHELTEDLRRKLFSASELSVDAEGFTAWLTGVVPLTEPPSAPFMTAVEAVYFLAGGAFLTWDDVAAIVGSPDQNCGLGADRRHAAQHAVGVGRTKTIPRSCGGRSYLARKEGATLRC